VHREEASGTTLADIVETFAASADPIIEQHARGVAEALIDLKRARRRRLSGELSVQ
jgi:hypothetical protein